jgi:protein sidekick
MVKNDQVFSIYLQLLFIVIISIESSLSFVYLVPDEVSNLRFDEISDRSVRVSWSPPEKNNGILTGYTVRWSVKDMPHTIKVKNVSSDLTNLVVNSLQVLYIRFKIVI